MKKLLSALMILMLLLSSACAETCLITGEVVEVSAPGDVRILVNESAFEATYNDKQFFGAVQADGTLLLGTPEKAVRLAGLPDLSLFVDVWQRLDTQPTYDNAVYSSLFTKAQQIELTAREVGDYMLAILFSRQGRFADAAECYLRACKLNPTFVHRGNLDPEISDLIKRYGLDSSLRSE